MTEQQPYTVVSEHDGFEVRHYPTAHLVQVDVAGEFDRAGNLGFGPLVQYISGNNAGGTRMAMTAPVLQAPRAEREHTVSFVLPEGLSAADIPAPADARVRTVVVPEHLVAARRFRGGWSGERFAREGGELATSVAAAGLATAGDVYFARYDPPWTPPFLKRSEALVDLVG